MSIRRRVSLRAQLDGTREKYRTKRRMASNMVKRDGIITECRMFEPYMAIPTPSMPTTPSIHPMNHADVVKIRIQKASIKVWRRRKVGGRRRRSCIGAFRARIELVDFVRNVAVPS